LTTSKPKTATLFGFAYTEKALRYLEKLPTAKLRSQVKSKIDSLANDPVPPTAKQLRGEDEGGEPIYRIRSGDYRVLYLVRSNPKHVVILDIGNRKDIYK
jgi:mRNA interferase RelE/StbE